MNLPLVLFVVGEVVLISGLLLLLRRAIVEWRYNRSLDASLRRIRARIHPHRCPSCGIEHGGIGW